MRPYRLSVYCFSFWWLRDKSHFIIFSTSNRQDESLKIVMGKRINAMCCLFWYILIILFRWLSERLSYLQCISNGNTAVLHWAIDWVMLVFAILLLRVLLSLLPLLLLSRLLIILPWSPSSVFSGLKYIFNDEITNAFLNFNFHNMPSQWWNYLFIPNINDLNGEVCE